jgi:hypothetical protein
VTMERVVESYLKLYRELVAKQESVY